MIRPPDPVDVDSAAELVAVWSGPSWTYDEARAAIAELVGEGITPRMAADFLTTAHVAVSSTVGERLDHAALLRTLDRIVAEYGQ